MGEKIGIGIITCNRTEFLDNLIDSLQGCDYSELVVVNDGSDAYVNEGLNVINNENNIGVCKSKNKAMKYLLDKDCDYIFIIEDDMLIKDKDIFKHYINAYKETSIHHMMFGYHGPANKGNVSKGTPRPRKIIDYGNVQIALNQHCVGAFCFYTRECLEKVGLNDEDFDRNNFEHVEHSYRLAKAGYSTPYWWWSDLANSTDYIEEQACSEENSAIRRGDKWQDDIRYSALLFKDKHGYLPAWQGCVPDTSDADIIKFLKSIK
jgi:glycosyltransferase involved in cell wall biosynthesis